MACEEAAMAESAETLIKGERRLDQVVLNDAAVSVQVADLHSIAVDEWEEQRTSVRRRRGRRTLLFLVHCAAVPVESTPDMLTRVPLDIVFEVVRCAVDRYACDESWPTYQRRLAGLCRVCRLFRELVQPVLWKTLRVKTTEQFQQVAGREGRNNHLFKHVEEFRGEGSYGLERLQDATTVLASLLPQLQSIFAPQF
jgi:hypothetical protein